MITNTEDDLLVRISRGDTEAVSDCIARYGDLVWALARRLSATEADAEDAAQEIFLDLWKNSSRFDPSKSPEQAFVVLVARRKLIDRTRKANTMKSLLNRPGKTANVDFEGTRHCTEVDHLEINEEAAKAKRCLAELPPQHQSILKMTIYEGSSQTAVSDGLGLPLGTVKSVCRRGILKIRDCMSKTSRSDSPVSNSMTGVIS
jgi:RNA polymerase sigma-70 factor (ECF subfamily)